MAPMKGLTVFIADVRKCKSQWQPSLNGYNRKKYVCKLIYMSLLGYDVHFGHKEAVELVNSPKYSEKQIGYLAVSLLLTESSGFMRSVVTALRRDLYDTNECNACLALSAVTNVATREIAETLTEDIVLQLLSSSASMFVKKKAALCLLRLLRRFPEAVKARQWAARVVPYIGHRDIGVTLAVTSLVTALVQQHPDETRKAAALAVRRLNSLLADNEHTVDYVYYRVPAPWLQVKLLRLLQYFPAPESAELRGMLTSTLRRIIDQSQDAASDLQQMNAQYAVLFEAISLGIHLDADQALLQQSAALLGRFITSRETNVRYLGLETMAHLAAYIDDVSAIKRYQGVIIQSLRDRDTSVRRRALDLLYSMCDVDSARAIVGELLRHMAVADVALREEMALKVAILTEKFATEYAWYVDVMMRLVSLAGDHMGDEVWHRIVQVVLGNEELQLYACKIALQTLRAPVCHESAFKVSAYVLGEFGHLIANAPDCAPIDQLKALQAKMGPTSPAARAVALTAIAKFTNLFPEIKTLCLRVLDRFRAALDVELQQRACEYYALATVESEDLLPIVFEEMPPFPERQSALMSRLLSKGADTEDQRTWVLGTRDPNRERSGAQQQQQLPQSPPPGGEAGVPRAADPAAGAGKASSEAKGEAAGAAGAVMPEEQAQAARGRKHYARLLWENDGILHDGDEIQVGVVAQYKPPAGRVGVFLGNKAAVAICDVTIEARSGEGSLEIRLAENQAPPTSLVPLAQARIFFDVTCKDVFATAPTLHITYSLAGEPTELELQLPVTAAHFMDPVTIAVGDFFARWKQLGDAGIGEAQEVFRTPFLATDGGAGPWLRSVVGGMGFALIHGADPVPDNIVAVGIASTATGGRFGCLMRVEPKQSHGLTRVTVRATNSGLAAAVAANLSMIFASR
ncbi:hypothetical protein LPJ61_000160 [Coemansia biformis]|uniref:AP-2 complex subunit alpha n=1 Tax=Coemansia biformis TaxID=1286918 RepID=A0A9W8D1W1_9FUNG|nr:hypothetical protein LPJ61_000160 [Coemansia biformis]